MVSETQGDSIRPKGLLQHVLPGSAAFREIVLPPLQSSYLYNDSRKLFVYNSASLVDNPDLQARYDAFRLEKRACGYSEKELEETFCFLLFDDKNKATDLQTCGLLAGHSTCSILGDPSKGVYVSKYSDCLDLRPWYHGRTGHIAIFKFTKGRVKDVMENYTLKFTPPTPEFDCHQAELIETVTAATSSFLAFERTQFYAYEIVNKSDAAETSPRQLCPVAIVSFSYGNADSVSTEAATESEEKPALDYRPWRGQLAFGSLMFSIGLKSHHGALIPAELPKMLVGKSVISIADLRTLLPKEIFETCFSGDIFVEGICCSLHEVISTEEEDTLCLVTDEIKDKDLGLVFLLSDSGVFVILHSSYFLSYEGAKSAESVLCGLFVFPDSRSVQRDTKSTQKKAVISSEIIQVLPALSYAEAEVEKSGLENHGQIKTVFEQHLKNYGTLIQPGLQSTSPHREASLFPDQYDLPCGFTHLYPVRKWTEDTQLKIIGYLNDPQAFTIPVTRVSELVCQRPSWDDPYDDVYIYVSSPEHSPASSESTITEKPLEVEQCGTENLLVPKQHKALEKQPDELATQSSKENVTLKAPMCLTMSNVALGTVVETNTRDIPRGGNSHSLPVSEPEDMPEFLSTKDMCKDSHNSPTVSHAASDCDSNSDYDASSYGAPPEAVSLASSLDPSNDSEFSDSFTKTINECNNKDDPLQTTDCFTEDSPNREIPSALENTSSLEASPIKLQVAESALNTDNCEKEDQPKQRGSERPEKVKQKTDNDGQKAGEKKDGEMENSESEQTLNSEDSFKTNPDPPSSNQAGTSSGDVIPVTDVCESTASPKRQGKQDDTMLPAEANDSASRDNGLLEHSRTNSNLLHTVSTQFPEENKHEVEGKNGSVSDGIAKNHCQGEKSVTIAKHSCSKVPVEAPVIKQSHLPVSQVDSKCTSSLVIVTEHLSENGPLISSLTAQQNAKEDMNNSRTNAGLLNAHTPDRSDQHLMNSVNTSAETLQECCNLKSLGGSDEKGHSTESSVEMESSNSATDETSTLPIVGDDKLQEAKVSLSEFMDAVKPVVEHLEHNYFQSESVTASVVVNKTRFKKIGKTRGRRVRRGRRVPSSPEDISTASGEEHSEPKKVAPLKRKLSHDLRTIFTDCGKMFVPHGSEVLQHEIDLLQSRQRAAHCIEDPERSTNSTINKQTDASKMPLADSNNSVPKVKRNKSARYTVIPISELKTVFKAGNSKKEEDRGPDLRLKRAREEDKRHTSNSEIGTESNFSLEETRVEMDLHPTITELESTSTKEHSKLLRIWQEINVNDIFSDQGVPSRISSENVLNVTSPEELQDLSEEIPTETQAESVSRSRAEDKVFKDRMLQEPPVALMELVRKPKRRRMAGHQQRREIIQKGKSIEVSRKWHEKYDFNLDTQFRNSPRDKSVLRALHGPWNFNIKDSEEDIHLIFHMWIGLFYSKSGPRLFKVDSHFPPLDERTEVDLTCGIVKSGAFESAKVITDAPFQSCLPSPSTLSLETATSSQTKVLPSVPAYGPVEITLCQPDEVLKLLNASESPETSDIQVGLECYPASPQCDALDLSLKSYCPLNFSPASSSSSSPNTSASYSTLVSTNLSPSRHNNLSGKGLQAGPLNLAMELVNPDNGDAVCSGENVKTVIQACSEARDQGCTIDPPTSQPLEQTEKSNLFEILLKDTSSVIRHNSDTKSRFFILETSNEPFFKETKELLEADGNVYVGPDEFDLDKQDPSLLPLVIIIRNIDIANHICEIPHLLELKRCSHVVFAGIEHPDDLRNLTHEELFTKGGFLMVDSSSFLKQPLVALNRTVSLLEELSKNGKWKWFLHNRDIRRLRQDSRLDEAARAKKNFLEGCQERGIVEVLPYHDCDLVTLECPDYLQCLVRLQIQNATKRFPVFITDKAVDESFQRSGIFTLTDAFAMSMSF